MRYICYSYSSMVGPISMAALPITDSRIFPNLQEEASMTSKV